jgi:hypothetical protein
MLYLSKTIFVYRFCKILVIEPTTDVKAESIGASSVKEVGTGGHLTHNCNLTCSDEPIIVDNRKSVAKSPPTSIID